MALYEPRLMVFLSSSMASEEFLTEREFLVWLFREDPRLDYAELYTIEMWAHATPPPEEYTVRVAECDVMLLLLGSELRQGVRKEVQLAKEKGIPILAFQCARHKRGDELEAFVIDELQQNATWSEYVRASELSEKIRQSLTKLAVDVFKQWQRLGMRVTREAEQVPTTPESLSLKLDAALFRLSKGNIGEAKALFEEISALDPWNFEAHFQLGYILDAVPPYDHQASVKHLRDAIKINPEDLRARFNLAAALIHSGEPLEAIEHFDLVEPNIDFRVDHDAAVTLGKLYLFRAEARANTRDPKQRQAALDDLEQGKMILEAVNNATARHWLGQIEDRESYIDKQLTTS